LAVLNRIPFPVV